MPNARLAAGQPVSSGGCEVARRHPGEGETRLESAAAVGERADIAFESGGGSSCVWLMWRVWVGPEYRAKTRLPNVITSNVYLPFRTRIERSMISILERFPMDNLVSTYTSFC
jgi:hypothetical protein